jgi:hypothetical protein
MGLSIDPCKDPDIAIKVTEFIKNKEWRAKCGNSARQFAEAELDLKKYQKILYPELCRISKIKNLDLSVKAFL